MSSKKTSTFTGKSKQFNVRIPLEWVPFIESQTDNIASYFRELVKNDLIRKGLIDTKDGNLLITEPLTPLEQFPTPKMNDLYPTFDDSIASHIILFSGLSMESNDIVAVHQTSQFKVPDKIEKYRQKLLDLKKKNHFRNTGFPLKLEDSDCVRLLKYDLKDNPFRLHLWTEETTYYDSIITNDSCDVYIPEYNSTIRHEYMSGKSVLKTPVPSFSNHIGVAMIAFTSDNYAILVERSVHKLTDTGKISYTMGGRAKIEDLSQGYDPFKTVQTQFSREFGITNKQIKKLYLIGMALDLERGAKPEFYFHCQLSITLKEWKKLMKNVKKTAIDAWEWEKIIPVKAKNARDHTFLNDELQLPDIMKYMLASFYSVNRSIV